MAEEYQRVSVVVQSAGDYCAWHEMSLSIMYDSYYIMV